MRTIIRCCTLFDITSTGTQNKKSPSNLTDLQLVEWEQNRSRQANFDTIIQVVSLRTQPEEISTPVKKVVNFQNSEMFGFLFEQEEPQPYWSFDFTIYYSGVYNDGISELGLLLQDCDGVPMLPVLSAWDKLPNFLDTSPELKNIYFEVISSD